MADKLLNIIVKAKDEATSQLKNIGEVAFSGLNKISNAAGIAAGAIKGFSILAVKNLADTGEMLDNLSAKTGASVESLSAMKASGDAMGISLEAITGTMNKMNINLASLEANGKKGDAALKPIGLTLKDLKGLNPEDQFFKIGNALAKIEDPARRAAETTKLFGKAGTDLLPFFDKGNSSLQEMTDSAAEFGQVMTDEGIAAAREADKAMDNLTRSLDGAKNQIAIALAPAITDLVNKIQPVIARVSEWIEKNPELTQTILAITTGVLGLIFILPKVIAGIEAVGAAFTFLTANPLGIAIVAIAAVTAAVVYLWTTNEGFRNAIIAIWNAILTFLKIIWEGIVKGITSFVESVKVIWSGWAAIFEFLKNIWGQIIEFLNGIFTNVTTAIQNGMAEAQKAWDGAWNAMYATVDKIVGPIMKLINQIKGAVDGAVDAVYRLGGAGQSSVSLTPESQARLNSMGKGGLLNKAGGGNVMAGHSYVVGEHGSELLTMGTSSGRITPNDELGGGGVNIVISGNTLLDSNAALKIGDMIVRRLGLQRKLA